jgi:hypothetical protein
MVRLKYAALGIVAACIFVQSATMAEATGSCKSNRQCKVAAAPLEGGQCRVVIDRSQSAGVFDVSRQTDSNGSCICYAYTGPDSQDAATELKVAQLVERKSCSDAKAMAVLGPSAAAAAGGSGFLAGPLAPLLGLGALGGGTAIAAASSAGAEPVSP